MELAHPGSQELSALKWSPPRGGLQQLELPFASQQTNSNPKSPHCTDARSIQMPHLRVIPTIALVATWHLLLVAGPALAQSDQDRIPLIMSNLPPQDSAAYHAIKRHAANPTIHVLPLTKTEVWSVPPDMVATVRRLAAQHGAAASQPGTNWKHMFRRMRGGMMMKGMKGMMRRMRGMTARGEMMMRHVMSSRATMGMAMMGMPQAAQLEYALTKDLGSQVARARPHEIIIDLDDKTSVTVARTSATIETGMLIWTGTVEGTDEPVVLMWWPGSTITGTIHHHGRIYSIRSINGTLQAMVEMDADKMPPEHAPMPQRMRLNDPALRDDPLVHQGDASMLRPAKAGMPSSKPGPPPSAGQPVPSTKDVTIDVIVAYTKKAAANYADIKRDLIELAIEEANESFRWSNISNVKLRLVHAYQTDYVEEGAHFDHVWRFADKGDGYMDEIHALRDKYRADVAILIVDDAHGCGLATRVFADADEAFAVVHHECAATTYSLAHEIGHLIGARHDLNLDKIMTPFPYGHGYVDGTKWRSIMSYKESCGGCSRLPVWSSPKVLVRGDVAGSAVDRDNARVIAEQAARVAAFR